MTVRSSEAQTVTSRELRLACTNDECRAVFNGQLVLVSTRVASACPSPNVFLPFARRRPDNDDHRQPANDDGPTMPAAEMSG